MERVLVVGSGASAVHFCLGVLRKGYEVLMLDVGHARSEPVMPGRDFNSLKSELPDPAEYLLGSNYEALILPGNRGEYYGFPPNKQYIFAQPARFQYSAQGFSPLVSFAAGGLAEAWTGGSYPFNQADLAAFPFSYSDLAPYYAEVARRIGITGEADDLAEFFPLHGGLSQPLRLDEHSELLLASYQRRKRYLNERLNCFVGRARIAVVSADREGRHACNYLGRCLWGCPSDALYTPAVTLRECLAYPNFTYRTGTYVTHFRYSAGGRVTGVVGCDLASGNTEEFRAGRVVLAAGTLSSSAIFLNSVYRDTGEILTLRGLMDNRQVLMPFLNLQLLGKPYNPNSYQYHQLAIGVRADPPENYIHGLVTTLKTAMIHPVVQSLPFDLGTAVSFFRNIRAALGLVNINFPDRPRPENCVTLDFDSRSREPRLAIHYQPERGEPERLRAGMRLFRGILWKMGCFAPSPMAHVRPMGASVHYAGTIPMRLASEPLTCSPFGQSYDFPNLYFVDGTGFPFLPAKNLTLTLMANAARVAECAF
jgi:choline dehydrogenase-like flavoprotein